VKKEKYSGKRKVIAVVGTIGLIDEERLKRLLFKYDVISLTWEKEKEQNQPGEAQNQEWRKADLFSLLEVEKGLAGVDYVVYIAHPRLPAARLTQGHAQDMELIVADNIARAAKKMGVKRIFYLQDSQEKADLEVEATLRAHDMPVTVRRIKLREDKQTGSQKPGTNAVRSVQRFILPEGKTAVWVANEYAEWLPRYLKPFIKVHKKEGKSLWFSLTGIHKPLLELTYSSLCSTQNRVVYTITGGLLARTDISPYRGRLEFREVVNGKYVIAAIHDFMPKLPWLFYIVTQVPLHLWVMYAYGRHLENRYRNG
jgi:hypothetical protein